jgi:hypothetical protein
MKEAEARDVVGMIRAATTIGKDLDAGTMDYWVSQIQPLDAEAATRAVIAGSKEWRYFPSWAQFYEIYRAEKRKLDDKLLAEQVGEQRASLPPAEGKYGVEAPEWVWVWSWCRFRRDPKEERPFPQQAEYADPTTVLTMDEYETIHEEWKAAGSPKSQNPIPLSV